MPNLFQSVCVAVKGWVDVGCIYLLSSIYLTILLLVVCTLHHQLIHFNKFHQCINIHRPNTFGPSSCGRPPRWANSRCPDGDGMGLCGPRRRKQKEQTNWVQPAPWTGPCGDQRLWERGIFVKSPNLHLVNERPRSAQPPGWVYRCSGKAGVPAWSSGCVVS